MLVIYLALRGLLLLWLTGSSALPWLGLVINILGLFLVFACFASFCWVYKPVMKFTLALVVV
jgi:hypothetical protein